MHTMLASTELEYVRRVVNRSDQTRLRRVCASNRSHMKLAQLVKRSLMVRGVASLIPSNAVFAHVNIELA